MSIENHPNLHTVGLLVDITRALELRLRGRAAELKNQTMALMLPRIESFVNEMDEHIDIAMEFTKFDERR